MHHSLTYSFRPSSYKPHTLDCSCQFHAELPDIDTVKTMVEWHRKRHEFENDFSFEMAGLPSESTTAPEPQPAEPTSAPEPVESKSEEGDG